MFFVFGTSGPIPISLARVLAREAERGLSLELADRSILPTLHRFAPAWGGPALPARCFCPTSSEGDTGNSPR